MPRLLDLYCGEGGATAGYQHVGFEVWGVDWHKMPRYCGDHFSCGNVLELPMWFLCAFDAIHASPPCQFFTSLNNGNCGNAHEHYDLISSTRELLQASGLPYVLENIPAAPLIEPLMLCGSMFALEITEGYLRRHRHFESNVPLVAPGECVHDGQAIGVYGTGGGGKMTRGTKANVAQARALMEMPWASRAGVSEAIPPAYTEWIGLQLLRYV